MEHPGTSTFVDENMYINPQLIRLLEGKWQPTSSELEQLLDHVTTCMACQTTLAVGIEILNIESRKLEDNFKEDVDALLSSYERIVHETLLQNQVSAYIDVVEMEGEEKARVRFPLLARHIETCEICQTDIKETLVLLREMQEAGLMEPFITVQS